MVTRKESSAFTGQGIVACGQWHDRLLAIENMRLVMVARVWHLHAGVDLVGRYNRMVRFTLCCSMSPWRVCSLAHHTDVSYGLSFFLQLHNLVFVIAARVRCWREKESSLWLTCFNPSPVGN